MSSKTMANINMSPEDFVNSQNIPNKAMEIENLLEDGHDFSPKIVDWLIKVLELEVEKENGLFNSAAIGAEAEFIIRLVKAVGKDIHREDIREMLGRLYKNSIEQSGLFYALESCIISCIDDEIEDVRQWSLACIRGKSRIKNATDLEPFLINLLIDEEIPYYLKQEAALALGARGTEKAKITLENFAAKLIRNPGGDLYDQTINNILKESVAQGLGFTGDEESVRRLTALQIFSDDLDVKNAARYAIERIKILTKKAMMPPEFSSRPSVWARSDISLKCKIMASDLKKSKAIIKPDETGIYELELDFEREFIRIILHSTKELSIPEELRITIFTSMEDNPKLECTIKRRKNDLEMYGYLNVSLMPTTIENIKVNWE